MTKNTAKTASRTISKEGIKNKGLVNRFMANYSTTIRRFFQLLLGLVVIALVGLLFLPKMNRAGDDTSKPQKSYWLLLHRKSGIEYLYKGVAGEKEKSKLIKTFQVKSGIPGQKPTPLPQLLGREYWLITGKVETKDQPETAPYFLILDIPYSEEYPFGPTPYLECNGPAGERGRQCDWVLPGSFGLHGISGDPTRLAADNPGSSGCVRHTDEDITYLYNLFDPEKEKIRYYIEDV